MKLALRAALACVAALALLAPSSAARGGADEPLAATLAFIAPEGTAEAPLVEDLRIGLAAGLAGRASDDPTLTLRPFALPAEGKTAALLAAWKKTPPAVLFAWCPDGRTRELEAFAEKQKLPLVVLSPEPTSVSLDPARGVFWAGGIRPPDEALQAMDFLLIPCGVHRPAVLHDGSPHAAESAQRAVSLHHVSQDPMAAALLDPGFDGAAAAKLVAGGADGFVYFGRAPGAERLLLACSQGDVKVPVLLGQGLASRAVPSFASGAAKNAWALEAVWIDDHRGVGEDAKKPLEDAALAAKVPPTSAMLRGVRAGRWTAAALKAAGDADPKKLVPAIRALAHEAARKKAVFDVTGHANLGRFVAWRSPAEQKEPAFRQVRPTLLPMQGIPQIGTFHPSRTPWIEGTLHVQLVFGDGAARTIEKDLQAIGLNTGGYESDLEARILDDLTGRVISRLNRLFQRNPDGSEIPGVSWKVSFTTEPPGKDVKGVKVRMVLAGDDPNSGGRQSGNLLNVYTTFIRRKLYAEHALKPPIAATDRPYLAGNYRWGKTVEENLRGDAIRSLLDGYSQGLALTGAHELGHFCGPDHDTVSPRSIMNVVEAVGLDFDWAEWIPAHQKMLDVRLGRVPAKD